MRIIGKWLNHKLGKDYILDNVMVIDLLGQIGYVYLMKVT